MLAAAVVMTCASPAIAEPPTGTVAQVPSGAEVIANSYIVQLRPETRNSIDSVANDVAASHGGTVRTVYSAALQGFAVQADPTTAARIAADPRVARVEPDTMVEIAGTQPNAPWHLDRIDQRALPLSTTYTYPNTAQGVNVYIVDTGILISHQEFEGRARYARDTVDDDTDGTDCHGHGTHVAGIAGARTWGVAKGVTLHAVRVLPCTGSGPKSDVIEGIDWLTANAVKPAIVNMSLRGSPSDIEDTAVRNSIATGLTYIAGAGNDAGDACGYSPGRMPEVVTVGNTTRTDARYTGTQGSNFGACLDLFAPGTAVTSAWNDSDTATFTGTGTSMASPVVAGAAALYLAAHPAATPAQIHDALVGCATTNVVGNPGSGSPNRLLFLPCGAATDPRTFENTTDVTIPDWGTAESPVTVSGLTGNASTLSVTVNVRHPYRGDLRLSLIAPDGTEYPIKAPDVADPADDVTGTFQVDGSAESANGTWRLRIADVYGFHSGTLDKWSLTV
ncbi:Alkaline serine exoprotease A precursor [Alloactinosynnema sp. L-07]|nr:Alkaline serine exoprotease A precursor [Alloactinosynnema sp. L-07]